MKSTLPGILLTVSGALITYWALTKLGLFVPSGTTATTTTTTATGAAATGGSGTGATGPTRIGGTGGT